MSLTPDWIVIGKGSKIVEYIFSKDDQVHVFVCKISTTKKLSFVKNKIKKIGLLYLRYV